MDTKALEKFCPWARQELIDAVDLRCRAYALDPDGLAAAPATSDVAANRVLTPQEKTQRARLAERIEAVGYDTFKDQMAYTWFNRFAAIRYMELHDYLPSHVRMLSSAQDGSFAPDCLRQAADLSLPDLDATEMLRLMSASKDEEVFRRVIIAQCNELAECLPEVFGQVDAADALTLPDGLLRRGDHDVLYHLVADIPESAWDNVEVLGWMYQFYNAQVKNDFFKSKRKAAATDIAPATQLFTPEWIVRYMVENSLGRLWMLNHPTSQLAERMEYYISPDEKHEDFIRIESPEDITFCDPACGSGHILSYAFELLFAMYEECGYTLREIPILILTKNLSGFEIDERAAQYACLVLALRAREHDRRFFRRDVRANVRVLQSIPFAEDETSLDAQFAEELNHLGEIGSLLSPIDEDMAQLQAELASCAGDLFSNNKREKLERAISLCDALSRRYDVVVANPPYMGSSSFNPFMSKWVKKNYPETKSDLCTCFIERGYTLAKDEGYAAMVTMQSWMFLGSFEKMRNKLLDEKGIVTMAHLGPRAFDAIGGEVVSVTADVLYNGKLNGRGTYFRLVDIIGSEPKREALLEAIKNPSCGYFYRADASTFHQIPGSPIAYWASSALLKAFSGKTIADCLPVKKGLDTGDNNRFLRLWHEASFSEVGIGYQNSRTFETANKVWAPHDKGGDFRRWFGNNDWIINWLNDGEALKATTANLRSEHLYFKKAITWSSLTSGRPSFRLADQGSISNTAGSSLFPDEDDVWFVIAYMNSSFACLALQLLSPTLNYSSGPVGSCPEPPLTKHREQIEKLAKHSVVISKLDWDSFETSWDFKRNPLL